MIAVLELLATLKAVKLLVLEMAIRGCTDNQSNEALLKRSMTKFPSCLLLMEMAEELSTKNCDMQPTWIRRVLKQPADDLTNGKISGSPLKRELRWRVLNNLLRHADGYYNEVKVG